MALVYADTSFFNAAATIVISSVFALCISQAMMDSLIAGHILSRGRLFHKLHMSRMNIAWRQDQVRQSHHLSSSQKTCCHSSLSSIQKQLWLMLRFYHPHLEGI